MLSPRATVCYIWATAIPVNVRFRVNRTKVSYHIQWSQDATHGHSEMLLAKTISHPQRPVSLYKNSLPLPTYEFSRELLLYIDGVNMDPILSFKPFAYEH